MLSANKLKCIEYLVLGDISQKEIAKRINVTEKTICSWKKEEEFQTELEKALRSCIHSLAPKALRTHMDLLYANSEMVRYMTAKDILDRAGYKCEDKIKIDGGLQLNFTGEKDLAD